MRGFAQITPVLALVLLLIIGAGVYLSLPVLKSTQVYKNYYSNQQPTFISKRANFSFKHPNWWPVSAVDFEAKNGMYKYLKDDGVVEYVDFEEEFSNQAGGPSLGFINVQKSKYKSLKEYVTEISKEQVVDMYIKGQTQKVTIKPPKIEYLKIGGEDAISLTDTNTTATFTSPVADYQLIRNGLLYRFVATNSSHFLENKERNLITFKEIISSIKFN